MTIEDIRRAKLMQPNIRLARRQRHLRQIRANGGEHYITDCQPWAIKAGCDRLDCPMRQMAIAPQSTPTAYHLQCDPAGDLADLLIILQRTNV